MKYDQLLRIHETHVSRDSVVGVGTGYGLDDRGFVVRVPIVSRIFSSPQGPDLPWGPPSPLTKGYQWIFPRE
jgi:hypothetical protein